MATKTISLKLEAYEKLRAARRYADESFSQVILRATWPDETVTAGGLLERLRSTGPVLDEASLDRLQDAQRADIPAADKWTKR